MPHIRRLEIKEFGGIREFAVDVPAAGMKVVGGNRKGKTTIIKAIVAALESEGADPSAIRNGADRSEIFLEIDEGIGTVRKMISEAGADLICRNDEGLTRPAPQTYLRKIFGRRLDALQFFLAKDAERMKIVLEAMPALVTEEDVDRWLGGLSRPDGLDVSQHGALVVRLLRDNVYKRRTEANKLVAQLEDDAARAGAAADDVHEFAAEQTTPDAAREAERAIAEKLSGMRAQADQAARAASRAAVAREDASGLRDSARQQRAKAPAMPTPDEIGAARRRLDDARAELAAAEEAHVSVIHRRQQATDIEENAKRLDKRADDIELTIATLQLDGPAPEAILATEKERLQAAETRIRAERGEAARRARDLHRIAAERAAKAKTTAEGLSEIVRALTEDAPRELMQRAQTIPGFDPVAMALDGVPLDRCSGAEQIRFAVQLAKRANPKAKLLIADGIERLDPDDEATFLREAIADGWQLICTRVTQGVLDIEAIGED